MRNDKVLARLHESLAAGLPVALATVTGISGSIPTEVGAKLLVDAQGQILAGTVGGGALEAVVIHRLVRAIAERAPLELEHHLTDDEASTLGMTCGGSIRLFLEPYVAHPRLVLVGAGHVNQAVARLARDLDYDLWVIDDRPQWVTADYFPHAQRLELVASLRSPFESLTHTEEAFLVIATRCHATDRLVLREAARRPWRYVGMIGSAHKVETIVAEFRADGGLGTLDGRLRAPIGLDLGGKSPASVALSILAEVQMTRYGRPGVPLTGRVAGPAQESV
ncbi:MAG: XdhC/CoxI family protein [Candidatus Sericytochromatia bacterium]|nr:XdhC/CoxI family protein [Candidatus Sericytochromatia bacterium]